LAAVVAASASLESVPSVTSESDLSAGFDSSLLAARVFALPCLDVPDCVVSSVPAAWSPAATSRSSASLRAGLAAFVSRAWGARGWPLSAAAASSRREGAGRLSAAAGCGAGVASCARSLLLAAAVLLLSTSDEKLSLAGEGSALDRGGGAWKEELAVISGVTL